MGFERYRAIVKMEEIRTLYDNGEFEAALAAADNIRIDRVKDTGDMFLLASLYRKCGEYGTAKELLQRIYKKKSNWRVLEELMEICLAEKKPEEAESYLKEYSRISGGDPRNYIFEYRIGRQLHRPEEKLLPVLQTLKAEEYTEKYAYELAKVYHKLGREQECMAECSELILWFGEGTYVERAKALLAYYRGEISIEDIRLEAERRDSGAGSATEETAAALAPEVSEETTEVPEAEELPEMFAEPEEMFAKEPAREEATEPEEEPMWEPDATLTATEVSEEATELPEDYEQMSLFDAVLRAEEVQQAAAAAEEPESAEEEPLLATEQEELPEVPAEEEPEETELSELGPELTARLAARGISFETIMKEFAQIESVRKQLIRMLEVVLTVRKKCHCLIITGESGSGKTTLGTYLAKLLYELSYVKSPRVAKISAAKLNTIRLEDKKEQLKNCCLIVQKAGELTEEAATGLLAFLEETDVLGTVILEDTQSAMNRLLRNHAECNRMFNNRVHLPKYDSRELMAFALGYINEQDYEISEEAYRILWEKIEHLTRVGQKEGRLAQTLELVKKAIDNADRRNEGTLLAMASAGSFRAATAVELAAEDFEAIR